VIVSLGHSYVEAQEINANRVLLRRDSHSAAHKTGCQQSAGTTNYVISAKLVPSVRRHSLKDFERPKSGFTFLLVKFLLSFRNKEIISYKILQKIFLLHRHFKHKYNLSFTLTPLSCKKQQQLHIYFFFFFFRFRMRCTTK